MTQEPVTGPAYMVFEFERRAYPLADGIFTIGRDAGSNIIIREPSVSRTHAEVRSEGEAFILHASGPTGTRINGQLVTAPQQLQDGDNIEVGSARLTFRRSRLPLGVSIVDPASPEQADPDIVTRRETITNPILGVAHEPAKKKAGIPAALVLLVVLVAVALYFLLSR